MWEWGEWMEPDNWAPEFQGQDNWWQKKSWTLKISTNQIGVMLAINSLQLETNTKKTWLLLVPHMCSTVNAHSSQNQWQIRTFFKGE